MNKIRELREASKMTQSELAAVLNVSQATLSNWERSVHDLDNESLAQMAKFFNCSIDYLLANSPTRFATDVAGSPIDIEIDEAYFRVAMEAKQSSISPADLMMAIDLIKSAKERDEDFGKRFGS